MDDLEEDDLEEEDDDGDLDYKLGRPMNVSAPAVKQRKKHNRFNGMSEEEVAKRLLPDLITKGLEILIGS